MGLIKDIPIFEDVANTLKPEDYKDPNRLLEKTLDDFRVSRRFKVDPHNKQHLFGKGPEKQPEPLKQKLYEYLYFS